MHGKVKSVYVSLGSHPAHSKHALHSSPSLCHAVGGGRRTLTRRLVRRPRATSGTWCVHSLAACPVHRSSMTAYSCMACCTAVIPAVQSSHSVGGHCLILDCHDDRTGGFEHCTHNALTPFLSYPQSHDSTRLSALYHNVLQLSKAFTCALQPQSFQACRLQP